MKNFTQLSLEEMNLIKGGNNFNIEEICIVDGISDMEDNKKYSSQTSAQ